MPNERGSTLFRSCRACFGETQEKHVFHFSHFRSRNVKGLPPSRPTNSEISCFLVVNRGEAVGFSKKKAFSSAFTSELKRRHFCNSFPVSARGGARRQGTGNSTSIWGVLARSSFRRDARDFKVLLPRICTTSRAPKFGGR